MKVINLKQFLTLAETARHLSTICSEEVSEADVLGLVLEKRLTLTANFLNPVKVRWGKLAEENFESSYDLDAKRNTAFVDDQHVLHLENKVSPIVGKFDLYMGFNIQLMIQKLQRAFVGGPQIKRRNLGSILIQRRDGTVAELQESFDDDPSILGSTGNRKKIENEIESKEIDDSLAKLLSKANRDARPIFLTRYADMAMYRRAIALPADCVLGVRVDALNKFEVATNQIPARDDRALSKTERNSLLIIIAAVCTEAKLDFKKPAKTAKLIRNIANLMGVDVGETTIESHLKKIPETLEARMKSQS